MQGPSSSHASFFEETIRVKVLDMERGKTGIGRRLPRAVTSPFGCDGSFNDPTGAVVVVINEGRGVEPPDSSGVVSLD